MVYIRDLKSLARKGMPVRVRLRAPYWNTFKDSGHCPAGCRIEISIRWVQFPECVSIWYYRIWRVGWAVEGTGLLNRRLGKPGPRVRISHSPPEHYQSVGWASPTTLVTVSLTPEGHSENEPVVDRIEPASKHSTKRRTLNQYLDGAWG